MGLIGDILMLPIRLIKLPFKFMALPLRLPGRIIFGSKKDREQGEQAKAREAIEKERKDFEREQKEKRDNAPTALPIFMSGHPDDMDAVCKHLPSDLKDDKVKAICASAKRLGGSRRAKRSIRRKTRRFKKILRRK